MEGTPESLHEMPEAVVSGLRSRGGWPRAEEGGPEGAGEIVVALSRGVAVADGHRTGDAGRRGNATVAGEKIREGDWPNESLGQGRGAEPDPKFQGTRDGDSRVDGEIPGREEAGGAVGGERWRGA